MANHHIRLFVVDGGVYYIHFNTSDPTNPDPGKHLHVPHGDTVKWVSRDDGPFKIVFKKESPFNDGAGFPAANPIVSTVAGNGSSATTLDTLKPIATVKKSFSYTVTFNSGVTDDPEIIIDDSGGTGGKGKKGKKKKKK